jgi:hypothetical protein
MATYECDCSNSWQHSIQLEGYLFREKTIKYQICIAGERACPPEDCGGTSCYAELLKTLSYTEDEEYEAMKEWVGHNLGPEEFDKNFINFDNPYSRWRKAFLEK